MSTTSLLRLPPEIRHKIWILAFAHIDTIPLESSIRRRTSSPDRAAYDSSCHGCAFKETGQDPHTLTVASAMLPLLTCRQIHTEAIAIYQSTLRVHACLTSELKLPQPQRPCAQLHLRHLNLRIHFSEAAADELKMSVRLAWLARLRDLARTFPALETLHLTAHMRPPIAYENLLDAIYFAGPLCVLAPRVKMTFDFAYVREDVMIDHPELGRVYYSDALEEHGNVIRDCMADDVFQEGFDHLQSLDLWSARLLQISQEHEQPWLLKLRAKKLQRDREEARMNARMNSRPY